MKRKLNVKETSFAEVSNNWGFNPPIAWRKKRLYIRCNSKGIVNWDSAPVWFADDLVDRGNYEVHK